MARSPVMPMNGSVNQLRKHYWAVLANVYLPKGLQPSLQQRTVAAWLWSRRRGTIAGAAAAALHGARWIPDDVPIELVHPNARAPQGVLTRRDVLLDGEVQVISGLGVTTPERTAFDIGRRGAARSGVARLDSLARATGFKIDDVLAVIACHPGSPGLRRLETVLERMGWIIVRVVAENRPAVIMQRVREALEAAAERSRS
ncbi:hypothetical protein BHQ23_22855 [Mycobacterium gordonae]|nr:hypothetical protein [Mycobacterium gordonae]OBS01115.1 hypothetical protein A9W98_21690 [Mycobacterium gordonae]ODR18478.1 hypothetical protein BHQ23_22855 [Mycobacterium gordonae]